MEVSCIQIESVSGGHLVGWLAPILPSWAGAMRHSVWDLLVLDVVTEASKLCILTAMVLCAKSCFCPRVAKMCRQLHVKIKTLFLERWNVSALLQLSGKAS